MAKPIPELVYLRHLRKIGWTLEKGGIDYNLYSESGKFLGAIKIIHAKNVKREVSASSVRKTEKLCEERGIEWPPRKKLKAT